jgi:hypothetical protein
MGGSSQASEPMTMRVVRWTCIGVMTMPTYVSTYALVLHIVSTQEDVDSRGMHTLTRLFAAGAGIFRACAADYSFLACSEASPEFD